MGFMFVDLFQPQLSRTVRKEIDSFEWTELVGNVGGTWGEQRIKNLYQRKELWKHGADSPRALSVAVKTWSIFLLLEVFSWQQFTI